MREDPLLLRTELEGLIAIPAGAIVPESLPDFKIYIPSPKGGYVLWAGDGRMVTKEKLERLAQSRQEKVFIALEEAVKYEEYLEVHLDRILESDFATDEQKGEIFAKVSTNVVRSAFEGSASGIVNRETLIRTEKLVIKALSFISQAKSLRPLARMIGNDYKTYEHSTKVLWLTVAFLNQNHDLLIEILKEYKGPQDSPTKEILMKCGVGALLHDVGKALIDPAILNKPGPLSELEWEIVRKHPLLGLAMLSDTEVPPYITRAVLQHHENFHGGGYPLGIEKGSITILARVLRIIDTFDAMTSKRPYKDPLRPAEAVRVMVRDPTRAAETNDPRDKGMRFCFDPDLLRRFIVLLGRVRFDIDI
jgi:HD-GYP domain-containing protein (c-di-GMP phosphodiesterase class II)